MAGRSPRAENQRLSHPEGFAFLDAGCEHDVALDEGGDQVVQVTHGIERRLTVQLWPSPTEQRTLE
jgi:hypothetical protein